MQETVSRDSKSERISVHNSFAHNMYCENVLQINLEDYVIRLVERNVD